MQRIVIAIGGNAITNAHQKGSFEEQMSNINESMKHIVRLIKDGYQVILTHGNGPQVGNILIQNDAAKNMVPSQPLDICVAKTQGQIGDMISRSLITSLKKEKIQKDVVTVLTHVEVDKNDSAFKNPTKPVGPFYNEADANALRTTKGYTIIEDSGRGFRRVVPSPKPINILEQQIISTLAEKAVVIAVGGGGIPVCVEHGEITGLEAVIDKDYASALLATQIKADQLIIQTGVKQVALNFGKPDQRFLPALTCEEARKHLLDGQFPKGSMGPKIEAALSYLEKGGSQVIITDMDSLHEAITGSAGTVITK
jgi:carbamate kinase